MLGRESLHLRRRGNVIHTPHVSTSCGRTLIITFASTLCWPQIRYAVSSYRRHRSVLAPTPMHKLSFTFLTNRWPLWNDVRSNVVTPARKGSRSPASFHGLGVRLCFAGRIPHSQFQMRLEPLSLAWNVCRVPLHPRRLRYKCTPSYTQYQIWVQVIRIKVLHCETVYKEQSESMAVRAILVDSA